MDQIQYWKIKIVEYKEETKIIFCFHKSIVWCNDYHFKALEEKNFFVEF